MSVGSPAPRGHLAAGEYNGNVVTNLENGETLRIRRVQEKKKTSISEKFRVWNQKETV